MESKDFLLLAVALVFFIGAAYVIYQYALPNLHAAGEVEKLYEESLKEGQNLTDYKYSYKETVNGYQLETTLIKVGSQKQSKVKTPIMERSVFHLDNDTILCVKFKGQEECSSVKNDSTLKSFIRSSESLFFSEDKIQENVENFELLKTKKAIKFEEEAKQKKTGEQECEEFGLSVSYLNLTVSDLAKLKVGANDPKQFESTYCVDPDSHVVYEKEFTYSYLGQEMVSSFSLQEFDKSFSVFPSVPKNLSSNAVKLLFTANDAQKEFSKCFVKEGEERSNCVFTNAIREEMPSLCTSAGSKMETCYMSLAIYTDDTNLCSLIPTISVVEDCYAEFGNVRRNNQTCALISNATKKNLCYELSSKPLPKPNITVVEKNETPANRTPEEEELIKDLFEDIEKFN